jgi:hypothetical protein
MIVPLFPLQTVLYPGGPLPLRIFEARYLDMISECLKSASPFGVLLIRHGIETGTTSTYATGTLAKIADWYQGSDGLLGVTAIGEQRFRLISSWRRDDGLNLGEIEILDERPAVSLPDDCRPLAKILQGVIDDLGKLYDNLERKYGDAGWVAYRFAEILPIGAMQKQACLELDDPLARLDIVRSVLESVMGKGGSRLA